MNHTKPYHYSVAKTLVEKLQAAGHTALFAGGVVRDLLRKESCDDIDIATSAHPHEIMALFKKTVSVGAQFGVILVIEQDQEFEVATFRSDSQYIDGRHPSMVNLTATPQEDAQRRDFTINGMMYDPCTETLYDYVGGQKDLENRRIRTIGSPLDRFDEDRLRMIRAIRFKNVLNFEMDSATWEAICLLSPKIASSVSPERIWQEFSKMHQKHVLGKCLKDMTACQMLQYIFPGLGLATTKNLESRIQAIEKYDGTSLAAAICLLFQKSEAPYLGDIAQQMRLSKKEQRVIDCFIQYGSLVPLPDELRLVHLYACDECDDYLKAVAACQKNQKEFLQEQENKKAELHFWVKQIQTNKYFISAEDLFPFGLSPGREMGVILKKLFELSLRQRMTKKAEILHTLLDA